MLTNSKNDHVIFFIYFFGHGTMMATYTVLLDMTKRIVLSWYKYHTTFVQVDLCKIGKYHGIRLQYHGIYQSNIGLQFNNNHFTVITVSYSND